MEHKITYATTEASSIPAFNWKAFDQVDWTGAWCIGFIMIAMFMFGILCSLVGFFVALWIVWIGILLFSQGIGALFINPLYCIFAPLVPTVISWIVLVGFAEITQAPTRVYRKMTR